MNREKKGVPWFPYFSLKNPGFLLNRLLIISFVSSTHLKNMLVKLDHFSRVQGENKKYLEKNQPVMVFIIFPTWVFPKIRVSPNHPF